MNECENIYYSSRTVKRFVVDLTKVLINQIPDSWELTKYN